jgi:hypothetical protein
MPFCRFIFRKRRSSFLRTFGAICLAFASGCDPNHDSSDEAAARENLKQNLKQFREVITRFSNWKGAPDPLNLYPLSAVPNGESSDWWRDIAKRLNLLSISTGGRGLGEDLRFELCLQRSNPELQGNAEHRHGFIYLLDEHSRGNARLLAEAREPAWSHKKALLGSKYARLIYLGDGWLYFRGIGLGPKGSDIGHPPHDTDPEAEIAR